MGTEGGMDVREGDSTRAGILSPWNIEAITTKVQQGLGDAKKETRCRSCRARAAAAA